MTKGKLFELAKDAINQYEDGFLGVTKCCELYCEDNNLDESLAFDMSEVYYSETEEIFNYNPNYKQDLFEGLEVKSWEERKELLDK